MYHRANFPRSPRAKARRLPRNLMLRLVRTVIICSGLLLGLRASATTLWNDLGATLAHDTGEGQDILGGVVRRDDTASDVLYFKFHVEPLSDVSTEEYFAGFELFDGPARHLAVGNSMKAWAYSAFHTSEQGEFNKFSGDYDLHSARPESTAVGVFKRYEQPRRGIERTIVFKVQYVAGGDDLVTVWLSPDLGPDATETNQLESLTTQFKADCSFNEIHLRHGGGGDGWTFSDMAIATAFEDFVAPSGVAAGTTAARAGRGAGPFTFRSWQREQGLPPSLVRALAQTRDGYLWLGMDNGLARFDGVRFVFFGEPEGLHCGAVSRILEDHQGALWIGSTNNGLTRWQNGRFITFSTRNGLPADSITALEEDDHHQLWVGTPAGLAVGRDGKWTALAEEAVKGKSVTGLFKDRTGGLWISVTGAGVFRFQNGKLDLIKDNSAEKLLRDPHCVLVDRLNRIWVGAGDDFVLCRDGDQWTRYRIPRHLDRPFINTLAEAPDGTVWAGSVSEGLFRFNDGKVRAINAGGGLLDNFVASLFMDREGNLWIGVSAGLNQLRAPNVLPNGKASDLLAGQPVRADEASRAPTVILEEMLVDGAPVVFDPVEKSALPNLIVPPGRHRLEFRYTGLSFVAPERIRFRYRVTGLDSDWLDAANRRAASYSYVPPGGYKFEVSACNVDGVWSDIAASLAFTVRPHFWQTWWFLGLAVLTVFVAVGGTIRFVEKRKVQRQLEHLQNERALERERARIAQDLHDDLGASLSRISLLSDMAKAERNGSGPGGQQVEKISQLAGQTLRALDEIVWAVRPGSDTLHSVVEYIAHFATELFKGHSGRCRLDLPDEFPARTLPPETRHNIFLIAKEALTNAFKHSAAREISVQIKTTGSGFEMLIQDDGRGFDAAMPQAERDGNGLENMHQRAEAIGAKLEMNSAPGQGTTIRLRVDFARNDRLSPAPGKA